MQHPVKIQWWSLFKIQISHVGQCHERGGASVSQEAHNLQPSLVFAALIGIMSLLVLVSQKTMNVKFPTMFNMIKFPRRKFNVYGSDPNPYRAGNTTHNSNQYIRGIMASINVMEKKSLNVRGHIFLLIIILKNFFLSSRGARDDCRRMQPTLIHVLI